MSAQRIQLGLFFGSFNPVHIGHMIIANHMLQYTDLEKVWMVISPQSPFKKKASLAPNYDRYHLLNLGIGDHPDIRASKIEFDLPVPSYTIDTLTYLKEKYKDKYEYTLIMGGDNLASLHRWKNYELILEHHKILVYKRSSHDTYELEDHPSVTFVDAPRLDISATFIRRAIGAGRSIQYLVPDEVYEYLSNSQLYRS